MGDEVEPAEASSTAAPHRGSAATGLGHVDVDGDGDTAGGAHRFDDGVQLLSPCARRVRRRLARGRVDDALDADHAGAARGEAQRARPADPGRAGRADDERRPARPGPRTDRSS